LFRWWTISIGAVYARSSAPEAPRLRFEAHARTGVSVLLIALAALLSGCMQPHSTTCSAVPSQPDETGLAAAIVFAGNSYALVALD
jgi:hypothetical protein